ncbi:MAG: HAD family phosphatase [Vicinamibacteria bacterium]|nr:HAD family phosphatase [Vicinamibacteria bacterium]
MTLEGVVFDFDGVIANSEPLHLRVYQILLAQEGLPLSASVYYERYLGFDDIGVFEALARDRGLDIAGDRLTALVARKTEIFLRLVREGDVLFDGAAGCLTTVSAAVPIAIASGALRHEIEQILDGAGLRALVPVIVAAGETPKGKPAPDPYATAVEQMSRSVNRRIDPSRVVAIEDSRTGLRSARAAGLRTLGLATSFPAESLIEAERVLTDISHVTLALLDALAASDRAGKAEVHQ